VTRKKKATERRHRTYEGPRRHRTYEGPEWYDGPPEWWELRDIDQLALLIHRATPSRASRVKPDRALLLETAAHLICSLVSSRNRRLWPDRLLPMTKRLSEELDLIRGKWERGDCRTVDELLGWKRPKKWDQAAAQRRAKYGKTIYSAVEAEMHRGAKTPDVFEILANSHRFPMSSSQLQKLYYGYIREWEAAGFELRTNYREYVQRHRPED
jgi:hypothetical protein